MCERAVEVSDRIDLEDIKHRHFFRGVELAHYVGSVDFKMQDEDGNPVVDVEAFREFIGDTVDLHDEISVLLRIIERAGIA